MEFRDFEAFDASEYEQFEFEDDGVRVQALFSRHDAETLVAKLRSVDAERQQAIVEACVTLAAMSATIAGFRVQEKSGVVAEAILHEGFSSFADFAEAKGGLVTTDELCLVNFKVGLQEGQAIKAIMEMSQCLAGDVVALGLDLYERITSANSEGRRVYAVENSGAKTLLMVVS